MPQRRGRQEVRISRRAEVEGLGSLRVVARRDELGRRSDVRLGVAEARRRNAEPENRRRSGGEGEQEEPGAGSPAEPGDAREPLTEVELSRLERLLDGRHELVGVGAVDQAVVERQREVAGRADAQRVLPVLVR